MSEDFEDGDENDGEDNDSSNPQDDEDTSAQEEEVGGSQMEPLEDLATEGDAVLGVDADESAASGNNAYDEDLFGGPGAIEIGVF